MGKEMINDASAQPVPGWQKPLIFDLNKSEDKSVLEELKKGGKVSFVSDKIESAAEELYHIENPAQIDELDKQKFTEFLGSLGGGDLKKYGVWVYYPWNKTLVHFPPRIDLARLRGSRNRNLINEEERRQLTDNKTIVIFGLSVGSNAVDSLLMQGIGSRYVIVDMDQLDPTNLNRIRASYDQLGVHKVDIVAKKISELDPFLEQIHYKNGVDETSLDEILEKFKPDIIIDEIDSLRMKIIIRQRAKIAKIPVIMATDDGDDILLDIERFDTADPLIFHGILPQEVIDQVLKAQKMDRRQMGAIIGRYFVQLENVPLRMIESLLEVGKTLPSWPQLGGAAVLSGLYLAYAAKKILLNQPLNSGRFLMGPEAQLNPEINTEEYKIKKAELIKRLTQNR